MSAPNHLATVEAYRAGYGTPLGIENAWAICNATAWAHRVEGFGLKRKLIGNNVNGMAVDIVFHGPTGTLIDILGDSENAGRPQWTEVGPGDMADWVGPFPPEEPPPPSPPDDATLPARVAYLESTVQHILDHLRSI